MTIVVEIFGNFIHKLFSGRIAYCTSNMLPSKIIKLPATTLLLWFPFRNKTWTKMTHKLDISLNLLRICYTGSLFHGIWRGTTNCFLHRDSGSSLRRT